ncbi:MAG TPA: hypothetical protein PKV73_16365 [Agriterribacter sp.]|nr:hypothetical protein [Agriterribacter sp.]
MTDGVTMRSICNDTQPILQPVTPTIARHSTNCRSLQQLPVTPTKEEPASATGNADEWMPPLLRRASCVGMTSRVNRGRQNIIYPFIDGRCVNFESVSATHFASTHLK